MTTKADLNRVWLTLAACAILVVGCAKPTYVRKETPAERAAAEKIAADKAAADELAAAGVDATEAGIRGAEFTPIPQLGTITFDYDSSVLKEGNLDILKKNAAYLKQRQDLEVLVAGFCDERGTIEYNLALGQKRAKEIREYYIRLGVRGKSVATISYGKESPACLESTEECWAQNRRGETRIRTRTAAGVVPPHARAQ